MKQLNEVQIPVPGIDTSAADLTDAQRTLIRAGLLRGSAQTAWVLERMLTAAQAELSKPWEHSEHWRNSDTGQVECECCCSWALDAERSAKEITALKAQLATAKQVANDALTWEQEDRHVLKGRLERLSAPVSDAEWNEFSSSILTYTSCETDFLERDGVDALILARAAPPQS